MTWRLDISTLADGQRALVLDAGIPDDAPVDVREGLARRALVNRGQACPCGARAVLPNRAERRRNWGQVLRVAVWHESDCPAGDEALLAALAEWREGRR